MKRVKTEDVKTEPVLGLHDLTGSGPTVFATMLTQYVALVTMSTKDLLEIAAYLCLEVPTDYLSRYRCLINLITHYFEEDMRKFETLYNRVLVALCESLKHKKAEYDQTNGKNAWLSDLKAQEASTGRYYCKEHQKLFGREFREMSVEQQIVVFISKLQFGTQPRAMNFYRHLKRYVRALFVSRRMELESPLFSTSLRQLINGTEGMPSETAPTVGFGLRLIT